MCAPLGALHAVGLAHCDLKPENTLVVSGRAILVDFGLAHAFLGRDAPELSGARGGTPAYVAPEVLLGRPVDGRADWYSFGCLLFEVVAGRPPFVGGATVVMKAHVHEPPPDLREFAPEAPPELADLTRRLLEKDPGKRPAHADEIARALAMTGPPADRPVRGTLVRAPFVGRRDLVDRLRAAAGVTLVAGSSGTGRSRLLSELGRSLAEAGCLVHFVGPALGLAERVRLLLAECGPERFPALHPATDGGLRTGDAVWAAVGELLGERGGVLLVDDLDLADEWTRGFVFWSAERDDPPVKLVATIEAGGPEVEPGGARRIEQLEPLSPADSAALVAGWLGVGDDDRTVVNVASAVGGVPSELSQQVRRWVDSEVLARCGERWVWSGAPPAASAERDRVGALSADPIVAAMAFLAGEIDPDAVAGLVGDPDAVMDRWLDGEREGWLDNGRFGSERLRRAIVAATPAELAARLRRSLLARLADPRRCALPVLVSAAVVEDDPRAPSWTVELATELWRSGRSTEAIDRLGPVLGRGTAREQVAVYSLVASLTQRGDAERSLRAAVDGMELAASTGDPLLAVCCNQAGNAARVLGRNDEARRWLERAVQCAVAPWERARAACDLGALELDLGRFEVALEWCARVRAEGPEVPALTRVIALANEGAIALRQERVDDGVARLEEAVEATGGTTDPYAMNVEAVAHLNLAHVTTRSDDWARDHWQRGMRTARRLGAWRLLRAGLTVGCSRGWFGEARTWLAEAAVVAARSGLPEARAAMVVSGAEIDRQSGVAGDDVTLAAAAVVLGQRRQVALHFDALCELCHLRSRAGGDVAPLLEQLRATPHLTVAQRERLGEVASATESRGCRGLPGGDESSGG